MYTLFHTARGHLHEASQTLSIHFSDQCLKPIGIPVTTFRNKKKESLCICTHRVPQLCCTPCADILYPHKSRFNFFKNLFEILTGTRPYGRSKKDHNGKLDSHMRRPKADQGQIIMENYMRKPGQIKGRSKADHNGRLDSHMRRLKADQRQIMMENWILACKSRRQIKEGS